MVLNIQDSSSKNCQVKSGSFLEGSSVKIPTNNDPKWELLQETLSDNFSSGNSDELRSFEEMYDNDESNLLCHPDSNELVETGATIKSRSTPRKMSTTSSDASTTEDEENHKMFQNSVSNSSDRKGHIKSNSLELPNRHQSKSKTWQQQTNTKAESSFANGNIAIETKISGLKNKNNNAQIIITNQTNKKLNGLSNGNVQFSSHNLPLLKEPPKDQSSNSESSSSSCFSDKSRSASRDMSVGSTENDSGISISSSTTNDQTEEAKSKFKEPEANEVEAESSSTSSNIGDQISDWIGLIQKQGFPIDHLRSYFESKSDESDENGDEDEDDDTWWEPGVVRVFDPYVDISDMEILEVEGRTNTKGKPIGKCNVRLKNGDQVFGTFNGGLRHGRGALSGDNMFNHGVVGVRGYYKDGILEGEGRAILVPGCWHGIDRVTLEGVFSNGYLEGPVKGLDEKGNLVFIGSYSEGLPKGPCWLARDGQGWLHGVVNDHGRFTGDQILYLYPDFISCIIGTFENEKLVSARPSLVTNFTFDENKILALQTTLPTHNDPVFYWAPSNKDKIFCDWNVPENYESRTVVCRESLIDGAGDGLFAFRDLPTNLIISYYNGLHIEPGEIYNASSSSYQIYIDWKNTDLSAFVDLPPECTKIGNYRATLGHKANHSFYPNCQFVAVDHPRFGRIPALKTIKPVKKGEELFCHYKYDFSQAPSWYLDAWASLHPSAQHLEKQN